MSSLIRIKNGVLLHYGKCADDSADLSVTCPKSALFFILRGNLEKSQETMKLQGGTELPALLTSNMNQLDLTVPFSFNIIEP